MGLVLTITMLVTLMSGFLVLRSGLDSQVTVLYETNDRLLNNARSGLQWLLSPNNPVPFNQPLVVDLFGEGTDSVYLERKPWGVFEIVISKAFRGKKSQVQKAMIGASQDSLPLTLYVTDLEKPIAVCGQTKMVGKCYVPAAGFKRAYIEGQNYTGDQYVNGAVLASKHELPELHPMLANVINNQLKNTILPTDSLIAYESITVDSIVQPFDNKTIVIHSNSTLYLSGIFCEGHIKMVAPKIVVASSCQLKNVLLLADDITINDNCTLQVQAFAREHVSIGKKVVLAYPSVVACMQKKSTTGSVTDTEQPQVSIGEETEVTGDIITWKEKHYLESDAWLSLDKATTIKGNVYVNGRLDVKGRIYGSTYCNRFFLKTASGIYENHLLNAELDASKLPSYYTGAPLLQQGTRREVLQWL